MIIKFFKTTQIFISLLILLLFQFVSAQNPTNKQISEKTDEYVNTATKFDQFSGSILIAKNGTPIINKGYGMANYELNVSNTPNTVYRIASLTKQFTAMAIMQLQEQGKLNVNELICKYLENCPTTWKSVIIRQLLTHTSGIPNFSSLPDWDEKLSIQPFTKIEFVNVFRDLPLQFTPDEKFKYSNSGYYLLGLVIEKVSGESFEEFLSKNIFVPLEMKNTKMYDPHPLTQNASTGYYWSLNSYVNAPYHNSISAYANGGLISTTEDLLRWDQALYTEKLVSQKSLDEMFTPLKNNYGYGWIIEKKFNRKSLAHSGSFNGFSSFILRFPEERITILILSNSDETSATKIANNLAAIVFGEKYKLPLPKISDVLAANIIKKGINSSLQLYRELKKNETDKYDFSEKLLDGLGWDLIENKRFQDAIEIFKLVIQDFPQSANAYDSLGEAYLLAKHYELALDSFKKFLDLDKQNEHAKEMIKKVEEIMK